VAWDQIKSGRLPEPEQLQVYNDAVRNSVIQIGSNWASGERPLSVVDTSEGEVSLGVVSVNVLDHQFIDEMVPAEFLRVKRGFESESVVEGVGTSLVVRQPWSQRDPMIPESGIWYPVTAVLNLDRPKQPVLQLIDPTKKAELSYKGERIPLEANFTAAFARDVLGRQDQFPDLQALFRFEKFAEGIGLQRISVFDPDKQVCILIHGIHSGPSTWDEAVNQFYADKVLREKFEFWTFGYPTGALIPYLSAELRDSIAAMRNFRQSRGATDDSLVVVGHSMGGLLAKSMTLSGGDDDWNQLFRVPIGKLNVSDEYRETLRRVIYYEPVQGIDKLIMCATPHRGSRVASRFGGRLVGSLLQMPAQLARGGSEILKNSDQTLTPLGWEIAKGNLSSLGQLRPNSLISKGYLNKPLNPSVKYYSIIGSKSKGGPVEESSDGLVEYSSAHIEGVVSEVVINGVPHKHHQTDTGIQEIIRTLKLP
tara:strand:- start:25 stop:1461 length:1437 start_codon:yes stop_codon:yes gene_type:complete